MASGAWKASSPSSSANRSPMCSRQQSHRTPVGQHEHTTGISAALPVAPLPPFTVGGCRCYCGCGCRWCLTTLCTHTPSGDPGMSAEPSSTASAAAGLAASELCSSFTSLWRTALLGILIMAAVVVSQDTLPSPLPVATDHLPRCVPPGCGGGDSVQHNRVL